MKNSKFGGIILGMRGIVCWSLCGALISLAGIHSSAFAAKGGQPQASLVLNGGDAEICYTNNTDWTVTKTTGTSTVPNDTTSVGWTVNVEKGVTGNDTIKGVGFVKITNGGSAGATVGNVVVNLQRRTIVNNKEKWVSAAADVQMQLMATGRQQRLLSPPLRKWLQMVLTILPILEILLWVYLVKQRVRGIFHF